jgi:hypothetical protein
MLEYDCALALKNFLTLEDDMGVVKGHVRTVKSKTSAGGTKKVYVPTKYNTKPKPKKK